MAHLDYARAHFKVVFAEKSMERRQGFFSTLREEVARGLSPARSRERSSETGQHLAEMLVPRRRNGHGRHPSLALPSAPDSAAPVARSMSFRETLAPLMEGPEGGDAVEADRSPRKEGWGQWVRSQLTRAPSVTTLSFSVADSAGAASSFRHSNLRLLLGVMGAPLAPVHASSADRLPHVRIKDTPIETSSAQYIIQQYTAATSGNKLHRSIRNAYAMGKVRMVASELENSSNVVKNRSGSSRTVESGGFVLWQMAPDMWYVELAVGGSKVRAGSNGTVVWRHTPWLGAHAAKGPIRPLRRALQGLDPFTTASMFANARCIGEKEVNGEDCFILKLCADPQTLGARSEGPAEIIRHVLFGYFSQRTGLLVLMEDSHLTRIQANAGCDAVYWETTISSLLNDYRLVEGVMIAHSGRSNVTLFKFGETAMSHSKTRMEEEWTIEEVAYNVPGLSVDCFIPPADIRCGSVGETRALPCGERTKTSVELQPKVAAIEKPKDMLNKIIWKLKI